MAVLCLMTNFFVEVAALVAMLLMVAPWIEGLSH
jgi:hypothetical protein